MTNSNNESGYGKILMSNVTVKRKRNAIWGRSWRTLDLVSVSWFTIVHFLALFAPFTFTWGLFWAAVWGYVLTVSIGITVSYHRNLSHRSFKLPKWLEYTFAYIGVQAAQRDPIYWASIHRYHHQYTDKENDAHSPIYGFWFSYMGWILDSGYIKEKYQERKNVEDLKSQAYYRFIKRTYPYHVLGFAALVYIFGGFPYLVWLVGVRLVWSYHITFLLNSVCHIWGRRAWKTTDLSKNNWIIGLLMFGEGWHNNHHAFQYSARYGLKWWEIDFGWYVILFLEALGLATNVKVPSKAQKLTKSVASIE